MILIPYFVDTSNQNWFKVNVFLSCGGRQHWTIDDDKDKGIIKMLKENGFPVLKLKRDNDIIYAHIDNTKLQMGDFYTWSEVDPLNSEQDVWRTFFIPTALWSCPIFKENFKMSSGISFDTILSI